MAYDNVRAQRGQAMNLAVHDAIENKQENNPKYIYKKYIYYLQLGDILQGSDTDLIQQVIDSKDFDKVIKSLIEVMK